MIRISSLLPVLLACPLVSQAADPVPFEMPSRGICAHRGLSNTAPENTLAAFREAILVGVQMIEFDVAQTKDGALVLMHDATVDRTTSGSGRVADLTLEEIQKLDAGRWKNRRYAGQRVPTLEQALEMMPENIWLNVHIKGGTETARKTADTLAATSRVHQAFLACDAAGAEAARKAVPGILICNMQDQANTVAYVEQSVKAGAQFLQLLGDGGISQEVAKKLSDSQVNVNYCCSEDAGKVAALFAAGVQFPLTDNAVEMLKVSDKLGIARLTPVYRDRSETTESVQQVVKDGETQIVAAFEDQKQWIHHDLWVETEFDTDGDGRLDRMHVSVARPRQTDTQGLKVPVVYNSSPYFSGTAGNSRNFFWDPRQELGEVPPKHDEPPSIPPQSRRLIISRRHQNDWVPRGFAVVHSASPGTGLSQGCPTIGADNESLGPKAVVQWLTGKAKGFTTPYGDEPVKAYWSTGKVGMTGTSYNGTIPLATATTGVEGLEAIIPVAPNTSYYHYYRSNGLVRHPGGYIGEDIDVLYDFVNSGDPDRREYCNTHVRDGEMLKHFDRTNGDYNEFWAGRDYLNDMGPMKAALLMSHAFNDWNVMPEHSVRIYQAAKAKGLPVQCYFHQAGHGGPPPLKLMNRWFTRFLLGVENGVEKDPKAWIVREGDSRQNPTPYADYPNPKATGVVLKPGLSKTAGRGTLLPNQNGKQGAASLTDDASVSGTQLATANDSPHRLMFVSPTLTKDVHISGTVQLKARISSSKPTANFSVWLVSLPWNRAGGTKIYNNVITRGWADPQNRDSLTESKPLVPGEFVDLEFDLQPDDHVVPAGQQIGLMIFSSDREFTLWPEAGTKVTVDLDNTQISLPVVGGKDAWEAAAK